MSKNPLEHRWSDTDEQELRELHLRLKALEEKKQVSRDSWISDFRRLLSHGRHDFEDAPYILYDNAEVRLRVRQLFHYRDAVNSEIPLVRELQIVADRLEARGPMPPDTTFRLLRLAADEIENLRLLLEAKL